MRVKNILLKLGNITKKRDTKITTEIAIFGIYEREFAQYSRSLNRLRTNHISLLLILSLTVQLLVAFHASVELLQTSVFPLYFSVSQEKFFVYSKCVIRQKNGPYISCWYTFSENWRDLRGFNSRMIWLLLLVIRETTASIGSTILTDLGEKEYSLIKGKKVKSKN